MMSGDKSDCFFFRAALKIPTLEIVLIEQNTTSQTRFLYGLVLIYVKMDILTKTIGGRKMSNHLKNTTSPDLLQHAENPVH